MSQPYNSLGIPLVSQIGGGGGGGLTNVNISAGTTSQNLSNVVFSNSNGVGFGLNGSTITASHNGLTTARASNDGIGLNTAQTNVTWTVNSSGLSLNAAGYAGTGTSATNASITLNSNGLAISVAAPGGGGAVNFSAGTTSNNLQSVVFSNSNGVSFGLNGSTITASHNGLTTQSGQAFSADASSTFQTLTFQDSNGITWSNNAGALRVTHALQFTSNTSAITSNALHSSASRVINIVAATNNTGGGTASLSSNVSFSAANGLTFYTSAGNAVVGSHNGLTTARASNDAIGLNSAFTAGPLAMTINSSGLSLNASSAAGTTTGFAGANISGSMTHNTAGLNLSLSVAAPGGGGAVNFSAGTTSNNLQTVVFSDSNGVSFGLNGSTITGSVNNGGVTLSQWFNFVNYANSTGRANWPGSGTSGVFRVWGYDVREYVAANMFSIPLNLTIGTAGTSSGSRTVFIYAGLYTQGTGANTSQLSLLHSNSFRILHSYQNSSNTFNHPTSTDSAGYTTGTTSSGGFNISSAYTGLKAVIFPIGAQTLTPGRYYLGIGGHVSSAGGTGLGLSGTWVGLQHSGNFAPIGSYSTLFSSGSNLTRLIGGGPLGLLDGVTYTLSATGLLSSMAVSAFGKSNLGLIPLAIFSSG